MFLLPGFAARRTPSLLRWNSTRPRNYQNDGTALSVVLRPRSRAADVVRAKPNVYRLAEVSSNIIDQCVAQGVPFAREYGGWLAIAHSAARRFRERFTRAPNWQQLLSAVISVCRQIATGTVQCFPKPKCSNVVIVDGHAKDRTEIATGKIGQRRGRTGRTRDRRLRNVFSLNNARGCNVTALSRLQKGALLPILFHPNPSACIPAFRRLSIQVTLMSSRCAMDGPVWVPKRKKMPRNRPTKFGKGRDFTSTKISELRQPGAAHISSRRSQEFVTKAAGSGRADVACISILPMRSSGLARNDPRRYGNLFVVYEKIR